LKQESDTRGLPKRFVLSRIGNGENWPLRGEKFVIGRSINCDIRISDSATISRQHAVFMISQDQLRVEDAGSANGTFINGERLAAGQSVTLHGGDIVMLGETAFSIGVV
jgi:pSer/pThr/pTyr-binding forkhead associated (FHA) protein